jgi:WD40 repeat protein
MPVLDRLRASFFGTKRTSRRRLQLRWKPGRDGIDGTARIWDAAHDRSLRALNLEGSAQDISFSRDGRRLVTTTTDGEARIWDVETGRPVGSPLRHQYISSRCMRRPSVRMAVAW